MKNYVIKLRDRDLYYLKKVLTQLTEHIEYESSVYYGYIDKLGLDEYEHEALYKLYEQIRDTKR